LVCVWNVTFEQVKILNHHKDQVAQNLKRWCDECRAFAFLLFAIVLNTKILVVSEMLDAEDVGSAVLLACTQSAELQIIQIQIRTMAESLA
jgi:hypothetical protein